jgi:hypothetical protein
MHLVRQWERKSKKVRTPCFLKEDMDDTFSEKARRVAQTIQEEEAAVGEQKQAPKELASSEDEAEAEAEHSPPRSYNGKVKLVVAPPMLHDDVERGEEVPSLANPNAAMLFLKADMTDANALWGTAFLDRAVQLGQPYPAITHCELWVGERAGTAKKNGNHFSTYLDADKGAMWTEGLSNSPGFYQCSNPVNETVARRTALSSWSAIPIFALGGAEKLRRECNLHTLTPYPPGFLLWHYPFSTWPLRAFSGFLDDRINSPAHCAALSARILRAAFPTNYALEHPSHWYGPSSLYLELTTPMRMEAAFERERPVVKATVQEEALDRLADVLVQHSDEEVEAMRREDAHSALHTLAVHVLRAGSRTAADGEVDQDDFREAQERYARGLCRYTWTHRKNIGGNR